VIFNNTGCIVFAGYAIAWIFAGETNTSHISWATSIFEEIEASDSHSLEHIQMAL
jgi:hypothetical protein